MSKYSPLWDEVSKQTDKMFKFTFNDIKRILGFSIDHSFLNAKKELLAYGYKVEKISLKEEWVLFSKVLE